MKVRASVKQICKKCKVIRRAGVVRVLCSNPVISSDKARRQKIMARIAGVDLPKAKRMEVALTYIFGIGRSTSRKVLSEANVGLDVKTDDLPEDELMKLRRIIDGLKIEGDLRREVALNIKRYVDLGAYRGLRHRKNLPVRGQRTHTNARTRKGPRRTIAGKKQAPSKG